MSRLGLESRFTDTMTKWSFYCLIFFRSKSNEKLFTSLAWPRYNWNFHNRVTLFKLQTCLWNKFSLKLTKCEILTHCFLIYSLKGLHKLSSKKKNPHTLNITKRSLVSKEFSHQAWECKHLWGEDEVILQKKTLVLLNSWKSKCVSICRWVNWTTVTMVEYSSVFSDFWIHSFPNCDYT